MKTLLVILAHPDDESFGPGGTLAKYAHAGVAVHLVCGTRGESGTVDAEKLKGFADAGELRTSELMCAAKELGLTGVHFLGFRDSGMVGAPDNAHPDSLNAADLDEVAGRIAKFMLELRPDTVITHDQFGGYGHPDHVKLHLGTMRAYEVLFGIKIDVTHWTSDGKKFVIATREPARRADEGGPGDFAPPRLYFVTIPKGMIRLGMRLMPLLRQDPRKFGRNKDVDLTQIAGWDLPTTAKIRIKDFADVKARASTCHASQQSPANQNNRLVRLMFRRFQDVEYFSRVYPPFRMGDPLERELI